MRRSFLLATILCCLTRTAWAVPALPFGLSPGEQCRLAIVAAERGHGIPPQLLAAIGRVESGRRDPVTGNRGAWPWTINAEGQGYYFDSKAEAMAMTESLRARGMRSIDVGCMQVNLMHHPEAFPSLDLAFEPAVNADYAARFLLRLHDQTGDWTKATANYHSANPTEGGPYAAKVTAVWPEEQRKAGLVPPEGFPVGGIFASAAAPRPANQAPPRPSADEASTATAPALPGMKPGANVGHGLDYYRAMPVRAVMPVRLASRFSNRFMMR